MSEISDHQIVLAELRSQGRPEDEISATLADANSVTTIARAARKRYEEQALERMKADRANSEEGRREAIEASWRAKEEQDALVEKSRHFLVSNGHDAEAVANMPAREVLHYSLGTPGSDYEVAELLSRDEKDRRTEALLPKWKDLGLSERIEAARRYDFTIRAFEETARSLNYRFEPTFGAGDADGDSGEGGGAGE